MVRRSSLARTLAVWLDDALGYGRPDHSKKWWWDLEDEVGEGILKIPGEKKNDFLSL
jgi:hypothetical protein